MKATNLFLSSLLVIALVLVLALAVGFNTNKENQVAYASNDSQTSVCFDEGNTLWFNMPDDNIYCHGAESFDEDSTGAFAKIDYSTDSIHFYKPSTNPIKSITGTCEQLKLIFDEAGTYNLDAIDFNGTGEGLSLYSTLTLTASVPGVVVNLHKINCQGSILYIEGYITVNVIGTDNVHLDHAIVECDSLGLFDHASLHVSADSRLGNHLDAYIFCYVNINVLFMTDGNLSVDTTKEDSNDEIYCIKCEGRFGRGPSFKFGEIESISLKAKNQDYFIECAEKSLFLAGVSGKMLENNTGKFNSYIIDRVYYYELVISKMYTYTVSFHPNGDVTSGEMPPVDGIKGEYVIPECQFVKEGQKFLRWNGDGNNYYPGKTINVNKDIVLYAIWENVAFPIEFQANGGTGTMESFMGYIGQSITLPKCTFEAPIDYEFKCWSIGGVEKAVGAAYTIQDNTPIIAVWKALPTYNITFNSNGGTGTMTPDSSHPKYTLPTCDFTAPAGYDFYGWAVNSVDGETYNANDEIVLTGDTTLYAYWAENDPMVVTYDDGEGNAYMFLIPEGGEVTVKSFAELGFVAPLGKTFSQWRKHFGTHTLYAPNDKFTITEDVYLMAQFNDTGETVCTISFSAGEGSGEMTEVKVLEGTEYSIPLCGFTPPSGKTFKCWDILSVEYQPLQKITVEGDVILNANFRKPESIAFDYRSFALLNGKLNTQYLDVRLVYDDQSEEPIDYEACEFYVGIDIIPANLIADIANHVFTEKGNNTISVTYSTYEFASSFVMVKEQFTVSFNSNGGVGSIDDVYRFENTTFVLPENSFTAPANKEFKCWSVGGVEKQPDDELTITADVEVKAVWQDETFVVAFEANGGKGNMDMVENVRGAYNLPANPFTAPQGKQFKGWSLAADGDKISTSSIDVTQNTLLYALWEPLPTYTVSFSANGGTGTMSPANGISGSYTLPTNTFTAPQGKQFKCWSVGGVEKAVGAQITVSENTTVTAVWEDVPAQNPQNPEPQNPQNPDPGSQNPETPDPEQGGSGENGNNNSNSNSGNIESNSAKKPLSSGGIAGIAIACVVVVAGAGVGVFFLSKKKGIIGKK